MWELDPCNAVTTWVGLTGRLIFSTSTGAGASGRNTPVFLENTRAFNKCITNTVLKFVEISALQYCTGQLLGSD